MFLSYGSSRGKFCVVTLIPRLLRSHLNLTRATVEAQQTARETAPSIIFAVNRPIGPWPIFRADGKISST